jgi:16S rRNA (guanine966-N2)-methyltransferase
MIRIITGSLKGRKIEVPKTEVRPTSGRAREAVFNVLAHWQQEDGTGLIPGAQVLDVCCGSGAMAFEALSRGAAHATLIDHDPKVLAVAESNARKLGVADRCRVIRLDATQLPPATATFGLVFLDPPYGRGMANAILNALAERRWLSPGAVVVCEVEHGAPLTVPEELSTVLTRHYGAASVHWLSA